MKITRREYEVIPAYLKGVTNKGAANHLKITSKAVEMRFCQLKMKLNCHTRKQVIDEAIIRGWIEIKVKPYDEINSKVKIELA